QPLCAVYRREVCGIAEQALRNGDYKIGNLFSRVPTRYLREHEITASGFSTTVFRNVNTPEEYNELGVTEPETSNAEKGSEPR
ncbi:MAG: hypothetical protein ABSD98_12985, partial [Candidatus Korobacteraceae bacterium]